MARFKRFLKNTGDVFQVVSIIRAPVIVGLVGFITLLWPDQVREVYRVLAQPSRAHGNAQLWLAVLSLLFAIIAVVGTAGQLLLVHGQEALRSGGGVRRIAVWLPNIVGALVPTGLGIGLCVASREMTFELPSAVVAANPDIASLSKEAAAVAKRLWLGSWATFAVAAATLAWPTYRHRLVEEPPGDRPQSRDWGKAARITAGLIVAFAILVLVFPVWLAQTLGALTIFLFFVATLAIMAGLLTGYFDRYGVPILSGFVFLAAVVSAFSWTDNHWVRFSEYEPKRLLRAEDALNKWLASRNDLTHYNSKPYPVFFVTAAGGGMYAAYHAAMVLARLQDRCPNFAQHVFAVSGVSGGSLGASVFASLAKHYAPNTEHKGCQFGPAMPGEFEQRVQKYFLGADFLAPVVAATLFPDFLQRFSPIGVGIFDRARALEASFIHAWQQAAPDKDNPFAQPFLDHRVKAGGPGPALLLNATDVEHGYRVVISPLQIVDLAGLPNVVPMTKINELHHAISKDTPPEQFDRDVTLAAAVGLSSRFPWILPAGRIPRPQGDMRVVDGGYIENSGAETVLDLLRSLRKSHRNGGKISVHIISITSLQLVERSSWQGISEVLSPLRAMLSTRESRGTLGIYHAANFAEDCLADDKCNKADASFSLFPLNLLDFPIPLGWQLSPISARLIALHAGYAERIDNSLSGSIIEDKRDQRIFGYTNFANGSHCSVLKLLHGMRFLDDCPAATR